MPRHVITISDLSNGEIEEIFALADQYLASMSSPDTPHRVAGRLPVSQPFLLATLFYEPSTRTRLSFESAAIRLGGHCIGAADPSTTSSAKGESIADTVRVVQNYADIMVLRHPSEGAAQAAADHVGIPVINGGDGGHEHPTQTLCDLYTLRRENGTLNGLNVLLAGDLKHGRTIHSLVFGLARFGARIISMPAKGLEMPPAVTRRLAEEFGCIPAGQDALDSLSGGNANIDAVYVTPTRPHQLALLPDAKIPVELPRHALKKIDFVYMTRRQKERSGDPSSAGDYPVIDRAFLSGREYDETKVLHPLPRVGELSVELDHDPRGVYFKQASFGVPVRMALIAKLLGVNVAPYSAPSGEASATAYDKPDGMACANPGCITRHERDSRHLPTRFAMIAKSPPALRCHYCETDSFPGCLGNIDAKTFTTDLSWIDRIGAGNLVLFEDERQAARRGYRPHRRHVVA